MLWISAFALGCSSAGSAWMAKADQRDVWSEHDPHSLVRDWDEAPTRPVGVARRVLTGEDSRLDPGAGPTNQALPGAGAADSGRLLGTFRNTYYDVPSEDDFSGEAVALKAADCATIKQVPRGFYEAVCVQGSGTLASGETVSFARRDCDCAALCPRTQQKICFDKLDHRAFPWGRGASGRAITPLLTVAVDSDVIPLDSALYIPEYDGVPRNLARSAVHDGCFVAQDRGVRVKGNHVDVFTGHASLTALWNKLVPSNRGVTVFVDSPRCARAAPSAAPLSPSRRRKR